MVLSDDLLLKKSLDASIFPATWPEIGWFKHVFLPPIRHFPPGVLEACPASRRASQHQLRLLRALEAGAGSFEVAETMKGSRPEIGKRD